jgi:hypothetical protein
MMIYRCCRRQISALVLLLAYCLEGFGVSFAQRPSDSILAFTASLDSCRRQRTTCGGRRAASLFELSMWGSDNSKNPFSLLFPPPALVGRASRRPAGEARTAAARDELKRRLYQACRSTSIKDSFEKRRDVEDLIQKMLPYSPVRETAASPLLQKKWKLYVPSCGIGGGRLCEGDFAAGQCTANAGLFCPCRS